MIISIMDKPRLNAETLKEAIFLLTAYAKDLMGIDISFTEYPNHLDFIRYSDTRVLDGRKMPKGGFPGFTGHWIGTINGKYKNQHGKWKKATLESVVSGRDTNISFRGFYTRDGNGGNNFRSSGYILIDDFPKIKKKYNELAKLNEERITFDNEKRERQKQIRDIAAHKINNDTQLAIFHRSIEILERNIEEREQEIISITEKVNENFLKVPKEFNYDRERLKKLLSELNGGLFWSPNLGSLNINDIQE